MRFGAAVPSVTPQDLLEMGLNLYKITGNQNKPSQKLEKPTEV